MKKYALFEFTDDASVEVGEVSWITNVEQKDLPCVITEKEMVTVLWPISGHGGTAKHDSYKAIVLAINDSKLKLIEKRNKLVKGESIETDFERGRGKRRKYPSTRTRVPSSSSSESDSEEEEETAQKAKKKRSSNDSGTVQQGTMLARELRQQMQSTSYNIEDQEAAEISPDDEKDYKSIIAGLQRELKKERSEKERLQNQLMFFKGIPDFIQTFKTFMAEMQRKRAPKNNLNLPAAAVGPERVVIHEAPSLMDLEDEDEQVNLSSNVRVKRKLLARCNSSDPRKLTSDLMVLLFGREMLASHSLTGSKNTRGVSKPALNTNKVDAILAYVTNKFKDASAESIRLVMTNKLSNEGKLQKKKLATAPEQPDPDQ
ncbi:uncharacterized protein [Asterias amurensis]|uniref:uncharacterized protein n=1 Tax=Asterias amurensis TaxID=7602 RepID=UPI003AB81CDA